MFFDLLRIYNRRVTIRTESVHRDTISRALLERRSRSCSQTHTFDALRKLQHFHGSSWKSQSHLGIEWHFILNSVF